MKLVTRMAESTIAEFRGVRVRTEFSLTSGFEYLIVYEAPNMRGSFKWLPE
jgi:hypothetical protein